MAGQLRGGSGDSGSLFFFDLLLGGSMQPCSLLAVSASSGGSRRIPSVFFFPVTAPRLPRLVSASIASQSGVKGRLASSKSCSSSPVCSGVCKQNLWGDRLSVADPLQPSREQCQQGDCRQSLRSLTIVPLVCGGWAVSRRARSSRALDPDTPTLQPFLVSCAPLVCIALLRQQVRRDSRG